jgi:predicted acyltransferase
MKIVIVDEKRLISLDMFRGITMAAMILVNNQGNWSSVYPVFRHAAWNGWLGADLVFPFFLFAVGASIHASFATRLQAGVARSTLMFKVARRSAILIALGLLLNLFPFFDFTTVRIPGVLQRIGLCYCFASIVYNHTGNRMRLGITIALLILYGTIILWISPPGIGHASLDPCCNLPGYIDGIIFHGHTYEHAPAPGFDPEGLLSTIPAVASTMIGVLAAVMLQAAMAGKAARWSVPFAGIILAAAGLALDLIVPINKNLWTPSYVLFMGGLAILLLFLCHYLCDISRCRLPGAPFLVLGRNALAVYILSSLAGKAMVSFHVAGQGTPMTIKNYIFTHALAPWFEPAAASLIYAAAFLLFWWGIMYILYRKQIYIKL